MLYKKVFKNKSMVSAMLSNSRTSKEKGSTTENLHLLTLLLQDLFVAHVEGVDISHPSVLLRTST